MGEIIAFLKPDSAPPTNELRKVTPRRRSNSELRSREYLTPDEVSKLLELAGSTGRYPLRDRAIVLVAYRHGLRVSELVDLKWDSVDLATSRMHVNRLKNGNPSVHPIEGDELRLLRRLRADRPGSPFVFLSERGGPMTRGNVSKLISRLGQAARLGFTVHPHMLRHATGYYLANRGVDTRTIQDYLGHKSIQHTVRYTQLSVHKFRGLWT